MEMDKALKEKIEEFKNRRPIDKSPSGIMEHYQKELQAIEDTLYIVSGTWKMQIIALLCNGAFRYSELEKGLPKITPRMLSKELKDLVQNELVIRKVYDTTPVKVTYKLTSYGETLVPLIIELINWGIGHRKKLMKEK
jgi:DNA-binding HxlR family transcriptional regulator